MGLCYQCLLKAQVRVIERVGLLGERTRPETMEECKESARRSAIKRGICDRCGREVGGVARSNSENVIRIGEWGKETEAWLLYCDLKVKIPLTYLHELVGVLSSGVGSTSHFALEHYQFKEVLERIEKQMWEHTKT